MSILLVFGVVFSGNNRSSRPDYCTEYSNAVAKSASLRYQTSKIMDSGRQQEAACDSIHDSVKIALCRDRLIGLRKLFREMGDSLLVVDSFRHSINDSCDTLVINNDSAKSSNLLRDIRNMWRVKHKNKVGYCSVSSINSAVRVFNTIKDKAIGISIDSFDLLIHKTKRTDYPYTAPFFPIKAQTITYRFDTGQFGYQFDVTIDSTRRINGIQRKWIH